MASLLLVRLLPELLLLLLLLLFNSAAAAVSHLILTSLRLSRAQHDRSPVNNMFC
jgi:hypothetical protein